MLYSAVVSNDRATSDESNGTVAKVAGEKDLGEWAFKIGDQKSSLVIYRGVRRAVRMSLFPYLRVTCEGREILNTEGPTILAPAHRSHLDSVIVAALSDRRIRAIAKESLFTNPVLGRVCATMGAIPVRRGEADLAAMKAAKKLLDRGISMIVFPEGSRNHGDTIGEIFDGAAWLAARTGAQVIPIGLTGTESALAEGTKGISRSHVGVVVGDPIPAPTGPGGKRANRAQMSEFTAALRPQLQAVQNRAIQLVAQSD